MNQLNFTQKDATSISLQGQLIGANARKISIEGEAYIEPQQSVTFNFKAVDFCDSAGVACLLHWRRMANAKQAQLHFLHLPAQMQAIIKVSNLSEILTVNDD